MAGFGSSFGKGTSKVINAYAKTEVNSQVYAGSAIRQTNLLYEKVIESIRRGSVAMTEKNVEGKVQHLNHAMKIIDEGLKTALNMEEGGEIAQQLYELYDFSSQHIFTCSKNNDLEDLEKVRIIFERLLESYKQVEENLPEKT